MSNTRHAAATQTDQNRLRGEDRPVHDWYRFVLSFPPHLVRDYLERFGLEEGQCVLDPFCGTGTTLVECKKRGIPSVGVEANPMAYFASQVKTDWTLDPDPLVAHAQAIAEQAYAHLDADGMNDDCLPLFGAKGKLSRPTGARLKALDEQKTALLLRDSISPLPLHKVMVLLECMANSGDDGFSRHERLALAKCVVSVASNLHFGPEVGVEKPKQDAVVVGSWLAQVQSMADDLRPLGGRQGTPAVVHHADARRILQVVKPRSIDAVITSPPYPNEKDYTRTTRLESVLLGFLNNKKDLRFLKEGLVRSNTRGVFKADDDDRLVAQDPEIQRIAAAIEARRIELGKTSGFERMYSRVTKLYFGGMVRHLDQLRVVLRPGARLAYVTGDQASYLRVMIRTGQLLADLATGLGYEVMGIDLFRTRLSTATREQLREEVVLLRWPGERVKGKREIPAKE